MTLLYMSEVARRTGIPYSTIRGYRQRGLMPKASKLSVRWGEPSPQWEEAVIDAWFQTIEWPRRPGPSKDPNAVRRQYRYRPAGRKKGSSVADQNAIRSKTKMPPWAVTMNTDLPEYAAWKRRQETQRLLDAWVPLIYLSEAL